MGPKTETAPSAGEEPVLSDGLRLVRADVTLTMTLPKVRRTESGGRALRRNFSENLASRKFFEIFSGFESHAVNWIRDARKSRPHIGTGDEQP